MANYNGISSDDFAGNLLIGSRTGYKTSMMINVLNIGNRDSSSKNGSKEIAQLMQPGLRNDPMSQIEIRRFGDYNLSGVRLTRNIQGIRYFKNEMELVRMPNKVDGIRQGDDSNFKFQETPRKFPLDNSWIKNKSTFKRNN